MFWKWASEDSVIVDINRNKLKVGKEYYAQNVIFNNEQTVKIQKLSNQKLAENLNFYVTGQTLQRRYFLLPKKDMIFQVTELRAFFQPIAGTAVLPFKFRPQQSDWGKDISLSSLVGFKHYWTKSFSVGYVAGIGIASVSVDSASTRGVTKKAAD